MTTPDPNMLQFLQANQAQAQQLPQAWQPPQQQAAPVAAPPQQVTAAQAPAVLQQAGMQANGVSPTVNAHPPEAVINTTATPAAPPPELQNALDGKPAPEKPKPPKKTRRSKAEIEAGVVGRANIVAGWLSGPRAGDVELLEWALKKAEG